MRLIRDGWLFNISGFDAVEIVLKNGRRYQLGTDEPEELLAAVGAPVDSSSGQRIWQTDIMDLPQPGTVAYAQGVALKKIQTQHFEQISLTFVIVIQHPVAPGHVEGIGR